MEVPDFGNLRLVGGTGLALQIGHRESTDIDLFGEIDFEHENMMDHLNKLGSLTVLKRSRNINIFAINDIKVDFVNYRYPWIAPLLDIDGLGIASIEDIGAMKLNAISGRGSKKDFIDLYFLLKTFSLEELISFYKNKYDDGNLFLVKKSLAYFDDADKNKIPKMYSDVSWPHIKKVILNIVRKENSV